jgi:response regulator of citrate/malate metabolism
MGLFSFKVLAFATSVKFYRRNSCIYTLENKKTLAKELGLSYNTFNKYLKFSVENNLVTITKGAIQFKNLTEIGKLLKLDISKYMLFFKWYPYEGRPCFKAIYQTLIEEKLLLNYKQQLFKVKKKQKELNKVESIQNRKKTHPKVVKSVLNKYGSVVKAKNSICRNFKPQIVSGKNHVAKIIGCSPSTSINIWKRLQRNKVIKRETIFKNLNLPYTHAGFEVAKTKEGVIVPSEKLQTLFLSVGSTITLLVQG